MVDVARGIAEDIPVDIILVAEGKNIGIPLGSVAKFDFWAKSKNFVSGIQWLTDSQT